ncbi:SDR family NAD(P)-dependent oxidoreductase [Streptomyces anthocyanicus]|uniref:SDR family NAD(P)-dependent oxidoreductase n=1 Tax=Streptomyces anthocyanicus TaxID=68174 RepID=UPI002F9129B5
MISQTRLTTPFSADATAAEVIAGTDLHGSRVVVTGGASGLGAETVRALASAGAEVTVATRRPVAAEPLAGEMAVVPGAGRVRIAALDLADLHSVDAFVRNWQGPLDVLVANAGVMALPTRTLSADGWEMQLAVNFLGHHALAEALRPALRAAGTARLVVVSSGAHRTVPFDFDDPHFTRRPYDPWTAYGQSKTADVLLAVGAAHRWAEDGITANAVAPGYILTGLQRHLDRDTLRSFGVVHDQDGLTTPAYFKTPAQGAATSVLLAASLMVRGVTGRYFEDNEEARPIRAGEGEVAAHALDPEAAGRLWTLARSAVTAH